MARKRKNRKKKKPPPSAAPAHTTVEDPADFAAVSSSAVAAVEVGDDRPPAEEATANSDGPPAVGPTPAPGTAAPPPPAGGSVDAGVVDGAVEAEAALSPGATSSGGGGSAPPPPAPDVVDAAADDEAAAPFPVSAAADGGSPSGRAPAEAEAEAGAGGGALADAGASSDGVPPHSSGAAGAPVGVPSPPTEAEAEAEDESGAGADGGAPYPEASSGGVAPDAAADGAAGSPFGAPPPTPEAVAKAEAGAGGGARGAGDATDPDPTSGGAAAEGAGGGGASSGMPSSDDAPPPSSGRSGVAPGAAADDGAESAVGATPPAEAEAGVGAGAGNGVGMGARKVGDVTAAPEAADGGGASAMPSSDDAGGGGVATDAAADGGEGSPHSSDPSAAAPPAAGTGGGEAGDAIDLSPVAGGAAAEGADGDASGMPSSDDAPPSSSGVGGVDPDAAADGGEESPAGGAPSPPADVGGASVITSSDDVPPAGGSVAPEAVADGGAGAPVGAPPPAEAEVGAGLRGGACRVGDATDPDPAPAARGAAAEVADGGGESMMPSSDDAPPPSSGGSGVTPGVAADGGEGLPAGKAPSPPAKAEAGAAPMTSSAPESSPPEAPAGGGAAEGEPLDGLVGGGADGAGGAGGGAEAMGTEAAGVEPEAGGVVGVGGSGGGAAASLGAGTDASDGGAGPPLPPPGGWAEPEPAPAAAATAAPAEEIFRPSRSFASRSRQLRESFFSGSNASRSGTDDELGEEGGGFGGRPPALAVPAAAPSAPPPALAPPQEVSPVPSSLTSMGRGSADEEDRPVLFEPLEARSAVDGEGAAEARSPVLTEASRRWAGERSLTDVRGLLGEGGGEDWSGAGAGAGAGGIDAGTSALTTPPPPPAAPPGPPPTTAEVVQAAEVRAAAVQIEAAAVEAAKAELWEAVTAGGVGVGATVPAPASPLAARVDYGGGAIPDGASDAGDAAVIAPPSVDADTALGGAPPTPDPAWDGAALPGVGAAPTAAEAASASTPGRDGPELQGVPPPLSPLTPVVSHISAPITLDGPPPLSLLPPVSRAVSAPLLSDAGAGAGAGAGCREPPPLSGRVRLGICAMDKKARSKPMGEILSRLDETLFEVVFFGDDVILHSPVEEWPVCDVLIAFYSSGYPLEKAERYADLRRPFLLNDLPMQRVLKDRRRVYDLLEASGIDVPRHVYMSRDGYASRGSGVGNGDDDPELVEHDDHIELNGMVMHKPFVEKPVDADDHNIAIYYPTSAGGGCKKLFRKVGDRSSEFYPDINEVRRDGSFIYEEFVETQGTDVKMYTVGPDYGHAEARKSPTVDGKVERNSDGKEVRFPVILTLREKEIARRIVLVFRQQVCGFDLLRVQEGDSLVSYVCDVNGWSFVKNSRKYYDDCAQILTEHMLAAVRPHSLRCFSALDPLLATLRDDEYLEEEVSYVRGATGEVTPKKRRTKKKRKAGQGGGGGSQHHRHQHQHTGSGLGGVPVALQRVGRMLQGVAGGGGGASAEDGSSAGGGGGLTPPRPGMPSPDRAASDGAWEATGSGGSGPPFPRLEGGVASSGKVVVTGPATLEEGAVPVRDIPHQLATEPPSMVGSAASSVVGEAAADDSRSDAMGDWGATAAVGAAGAASYPRRADGSRWGGSKDGVRRGSALAAGGGGGGTHQEELRCVIAITRHGDRTPKQKLKTVMSEPPILDYFHDHADDPRKDLKVKAKKPLEEFLVTVKRMIREKEAEQAEARRAGRRASGERRKPSMGGGMEGTAAAPSSSSSSVPDRDMLYKLRHMRDVLLRWKIGGLNRKLQIKPREWEEVIIEGGGGGGPGSGPAEGNPGGGGGVGGGGGGGVGGGGTGVGGPTVETRVRCTEVQLILKWGGNLTKLGEKQSINLGKRLRHEMYPDAPGGGILRLHSTFRHDLKIKTSDEGRVMKTAAAFAKGLLELEGEIPPILVSLVHKEKDSLHMLDPSGNNEVKRELEDCKEKINENLQKDFDFSKTSVRHHEQIVGPRFLVSLHRALRGVGNPRRTLFAIHRIIGELLEQLDEMLGLMGSGDENRNEHGEGLLCNDGDDEEALSGIKLYKGETLLELTERWRLLHRRMYDEENDRFDLSRVPDVHDNVRFDMLHNPHLGLTSTLEKLYNLAKLMADCVVPQEYGTTVAEKRSIGVKMCSALLEKIKYDLIIARTDNEVDMRYMINMDYSADLAINTMGRRIRTRLYFTSESHLHTLLNVLRFASAAEGSRRPLLSKKGMDLVNRTPELCYLTQVVMRLFEDTKKDMNDPRRFRVEILFSPGATATPLHMAEMDRDLDSSRFETTALEMVSKEGLTCQEVEDYFTESIREGRTEEGGDGGAVSAAAQKKKKKKDKKKKDKDKKDKKKGDEKPDEKPDEKWAEEATVEVAVVAVADAKVEDPPPIANDTAANDEGAGNPAAAVVEEKDGSVPDGVRPAPGGGAAEEVFPADPLPRATEPEEGNPRTEEVAAPESCDIDVAGGGGGGARAAALRSADRSAGLGEVDDDDNRESEEDRLRRLSRVLARQYFWTSVAAISFVIGVGCLTLAFGSRVRGSGGGGPPSRRFSRR